MTPNKVIHMIDTETTSLSASAGVMREVAIVSLYCDRRGQIYQKREFETKLPTLPRQWDDKTLAFTKKAHGLGEQNYRQALGIYDDQDTDTVSKQRSIAIGNTLKYIEGQTSLGIKPDQHLWILNHPEFDLPFLEKACIELRDLVGHSNIFDLRSLMFGAGFNKSECYAFGNEAKTLNKDKVYHSALGDCYIQLDTLHLAGLLEKLALV